MQASTDRTQNEQLVVPFREGDSLELLRTQSYLLLRNVIPEPTQMLLGAMQRGIDAAVGQSLSGVDNWLGQRTSAAAINPMQVSQFISDLTGFSGADLYRRLVESFTLPILRSILGSIPFVNSDYAGVFVADPRLPRNTNFYFHSDGHYDGLTEAGVNFWIPLRTCGIDAPGLTLVAATEADLKKKIFELPCDSTNPVGLHSPVRWPSVTAADIRRVFGEECMDEPEIRLGDVVAFTNHHIHRTHFSDAMNYGRAAAIIRYNLPGRAGL